MNSTSTTPHCTQHPVSTQQHPSACPPTLQVAGVPLALRVLPSTGMLALQGAAFSEAAVAARIATMVAPVSVAAPPVACPEAQPLPSPPAGAATTGVAGRGAAATAAAQLGPSVAAADVALALGCSTALAAEHLAAAEARGVVCRDDGPEGLRFYRNFFREDDERRLQLHLIA
jgi:ESCRT-II complex subunit VPS36